MKSFPDQRDRKRDVFKQVRIFKSCFIYALFFFFKESPSQYLAAVTLTSTVLKGRESHKYA